MAFPQSDKPLNPRKKPGQGRSIATVEAILEAAARILETRGFVGYNTNDIASVAGVSVGSLYQYFPIKAAISGAAMFLAANMKGWLNGTMRATTPKGCRSVKCR